MELKYMDVDAIEAERQAGQERRFRSLELLDLVRKGDHAAVELLAKMDPDLSFCFHGGTALMHAAAQGDAAMVELLLLRGASAADLGERGRDALMEAAARCPSALVEPVLDMLLPVSDPKRADDEGFTAMMHAARHGKLEAVAALMPVSDLLERDVHGRDIVDLARASGCLPVLKMVVDRLAGVPSLRGAYEERWREAGGEILVDLGETVGVVQGEEIGLASSEDALSR